MDARMITTPFGLYDCDVPCDGSVAIIVSRKDLAADMKQKPVLVDAVGTQITERVSWDQGMLDHEPQVTGPAAHLWTRTDLKPADIDLAELYDGFSFNCLSWIEALGFCGWGEAKDFLDRGSAIALDGSLPITPRRAAVLAAHGYGFLHEAVRAARDAAAAGHRRRDPVREQRRGYARGMLPVHGRSLTPSPTARGARRVHHLAMSSDG
jgi:acetyl-CoA acetyltransferase